VICIQCSFRFPDSRSTCPNCGRPAETVPGARGSRPARVRTRRRPFLDTSRWTERDRISGIASAVLLITLFLPWWGGLGLSLDAFESHPYLRIVLLLCLAILSYLVLRISPMRRWLPAPRAHDRILLLVTAVNLALVLIGFIANPANAFFAAAISREYGAFAAGIAAIAAVVPLGSPIFDVTSRWPTL